MRILILGLILILILTASLLLGCEFVRSVTGTAVESERATKAIADTAEAVNEFTVEWLIPAAIGALFGVERWRAARKWKRRANGVGLPHPADNSREGQTVVIPEEPDGTPSP